MSAQNLAAKVQPGSNVRWDRLENAAFAAHPSVLAPGGAANGGTRFGKSYWNLIWGIPVVLVYLFCYTAPVWGAAAISVSRFQTYQQDPEQRIPLSGIMFIFVLALLLVNFVRWVVKGRKASGFYEIQAVLAVVLGGLSAIAVRMYGLRDSVSSWQVDRAGPRRHDHRCHLSDLSRGRSRGAAVTPVELERERRDSAAQQARVAEAAPRKCGAVVR